MLNQKIRDAINNYVEDNGIVETYGDTLFLDNHAYDNSIIGITENGILIYDYDKMIEEFMADEKCQELDAIEWIDYNTMRALPYIGERHPIIMNSTASILEKY